MPTPERIVLFDDILQEIDITYDLVWEYDAKPHQYGDVVLYQAESYMVDAIGKTPGITITDLAKKERKTKSACSQILRKLMAKEYVVQKRNAQNHREYMLYLTETGDKVFKAHVKVNEFCTNRSLNMLTEFTDEQLEIYLQIQKKINISFKEDVQTNCNLNPVQ